ncbi:MAG: hypothetical protein O6945_08210 [Gammaproteobacteria bacterium]|nr:hypothetical protein [Gammaproteobacteria bacterium]
MTYKLSIVHATIALTLFAIANLANASEGRVYLMTNSTSANVTLLHLVNSSSTSQAFTGTLYAGDGTRLGNADTPLHSGSVNSQGRLILSAANLESLFSITPWSGPAILVVKGSEQFDLMTKLTSPNGLISNTNCVRQGGVHNVEGFDSDHMTYVRFINIGDETIRNIKGTLTDGNGNTIGQAGVTLLESLNPHEAVWIDRNKLSNLVNSTWNDEASLVVEANSAKDLRLLNLNFVDNKTYFNFSCYESGE